MVDHSSQIGTEKVMLALGVDAVAMPERGNALTHEHVRVLAFGSAHDSSVVVEIVSERLQAVVCVRDDVRLFGDFGKQIRVVPDPCRPLEVDFERRQSLVAFR